MARDSLGGGRFMEIMARDLDYVEKYYSGSLNMKSPLHKNEPSPSKHESP